MNIFQMEDKIKQVDLAQILLSDPIVKALKQYNPEINISAYKRSNVDLGFPLSRMDRMMEADINDLLEREPVEVIQARTSTGKAIGTKIAHEMKPLYEIQNGRHRIARAILDGMKTVPVLIL